MLRVIKEALTFDDVLLVPAHSTVLPNTADLSTQLTKTIRLNIPMLSAAMDTVTEAKLAISLAQEGGIGFIHKNMTIERQADRVRKVKKFESGIVTDPITVTPDLSLGELCELVKKNGFASFPVVDKTGTLVGIITGRDTRFMKDMNKTVSELMTPQDRLVTVKEGATSEEIFNLMHIHRVEKVLVVGDNFKLEGMITLKDFQKTEQKPNACKDEFGRLRVGAAVGAAPGNEERIDALVKAGVDILLIDSSHGHSEGVLQRVRETRKKYPDLPIIIFNVLAKYKISVDAITTSEVSVALTLDKMGSSNTELLSPELLSELEKVATVSVNTGLSLVALVGNNLHNSSGVAKQIFTTLEKYNIRMINYGASSNNVCTLVANDQADEIVAVLHKELFE